MKKIFCLGLLLILAVSNAAADSLEITLNDYSAQGRYGYLLNRDDFGSTHITSRLLYNDREETLLGSVGFEFLGEPGDIAGLGVTIGTHLTGGGTDDSQGFLNLGVGGGVDFAPPDLGGFGLFGRISYAPKIFSFIDSRRSVETGAGVSFAITPKIKLLAEYQNIRMNFKRHGTRSVDEGIRGGFQARF
jgi:opacity protein-like surface antigen